MADEALELARARALARQRQLQLLASTPEQAPSASLVPSVRMSDGSMTAPQGRIDAVSQQPEPAQQPGLGFVDTHLRPFNQGLTAGLWDEGAARLLSMLPGRGSYEDELERERGQIDRAREEAPWAAYGSEIAGAMLPALAYAPAMAGQGLMRQSATMGAVGAAEGAVHGFGTGEGGFEERLGSANQNALAGAFLGGAAPWVVRGAQMAAQPVAGAVRSAVGVGSDYRAGNALARVLGRAGMTQDELARSLAAASADGQGVFSVADALGRPGQRALSGIARQPGEGSNQITNALAQRQFGQADRMGGYLNDALGLDGSTAAAIRAEQRAQRGADAAINYPAADAAAGPVDLSEALELIDSRLVPADQGGLRMTPIGQAFQRYRSMLEVPDARLPEGATDAWLSDFRSVLDVKQALSDDISAAMRAGRNQEAAALIPLRQAMDRALEGSSDLYRRANDTFRRQSQVLDAVDLGQETARTNMRSEDAVGRYQALAEPSTTLPAAPGAAIGNPQEGFRVGYGDQMLTRMDNVTPTTNSTLPFQTPRNRAMMNELAQDPDQWARRLDREATMARTNQAATGGSMTADNLADQQDVAGNVGLIASLLQGRTGEAVRMVGGKAVNALSGMDEQTRNILARALMSSDPNDALIPLLSIAERQAQQQRAVEAAIRFGGMNALATY